MKWASAVSTQSDFDAAIAEVTAAVSAELGGDAPDLVFAFVSPHFEDRFEHVPRAMRRGLGGGLVLGCSGVGVIGGREEIEHRPALSVAAAKLPGVEIKPFHIPSAPGETPDLGRLGAAGIDPGSAEHVVLLADPFSFDTEGFLAALDERYPAAGKVGGLAGGRQGAAYTALYVGANTYFSGAVGVALSGELEVETVVAQGCRPVGQPMFVTASQDNVIQSLDGRIPMDVIRDLYAGLDAHERQLVVQSLFIGLVMRTDLSTYGRGDFLVRNILGVEQESGFLSVAANVPENTVVQFQLRDATTSAEDVDAMLERYAATRTDGAGGGALLFSCLGRGAGLYGRAGVDSEAFRTRVGDAPLGGFFCNGEIGDVGGRTFPHGYTSCFAIFTPKG